MGAVKVFAAFDFQGPLPKQGHASLTKCLFGWTRDRLDQMFKCVEADEKATAPGKYKLVLKEAFRGDADFM